MADLIAVVRPQIFVIDNDAKVLVLIGDACCCMVWCMNRL